jgi:hypothetical protein
MRRICALIWPIAAAVCGLVALAYASPPDPPYLAGIWDNADYDDIVVLVTSSLGSTNTLETIDPVRPFIGIPLMLPMEETPSPTACLSLHSPRAPPAL